MTIFPGVIAAKGGGGPAPYTCGAVTFNIVGDPAVYLDCASLTTAGDDTGFCSYSFWFKFDDNRLGGQGIWQADPDNNLTSACFRADSAFDVYFQNADASLLFGYATQGADIPTAGTAWHNLLISGSTNLSDGNKILQSYLDDAVYPADLVDGVAAFTQTYNGLPFSVGRSQTFKKYFGDLAEFQFFPGQFIDFSVEANRRNFISATGKPVDPAIAAVAFGAQTILMSGDASTFATNQGTGGAFTTTGTLTNASTSPSD